MTFEEFIRLILAERDSDWPGNPQIMVVDQYGQTYSVTGVTAEPTNAPVADEPSEFETVGATIWIRVD